MLTIPISTTLAVIEIAMPYEITDTCSTSTSSKLYVSFTVNDDLKYKYTRPDMYT